MKKIALLIGISLGLTSCGGVAKVPVDPTTALAPGSIISYESASTYDAQYLKTKVQDNLCPNGTDCTTNIKNLNEDFNFKLDNIHNSVNNYVIHYSTSGVLAENREVSGGIIIPDIPSDQIKGIVLYYHETEVSKSDVPSCFHNNANQPSYCVSGDPQTYGEELGGIIATHGYIVVMPDYVGLGLDDQVMHPYVLYPEVNALSGLYMLQASATMLNKLGYPKQAMNLYITGFSEGGLYAMWASYMLQNISPDFLTNTEFKLKATVTMSGPYDLYSAQMPMEEDRIGEGDKYKISNNDNSTYAKPAVTSYTMASYGFYDLNQTYDKVFNTEAGNGFYYCVGCSTVFGTLYKVPELYIKTGLKDNNIKSALYQSALSVSYGPQNANNSADPLVNTAIFKDQKFINTLESASITKWKTITPVTLIDLAQDSIVTNMNTDDAYNGLTQQSGSSLIQKVTINNTRGSSRYMLNNKDPITNQTALMPLDHMGSGYYQLIAAMDAINQYQNK